MVLRAWMSDMELQTQWTMEFQNISSIIGYPPYDGGRLALQCNNLTRLDLILDQLLLLGLQGHWVSDIDLSKNYIQGGEGLCLARYVDAATCSGLLVRNTMLGDNQIGNLDVGHILGAMASAHTKLSMRQLTKWDKLLPGKNQQPKGDTGLGHSVLEVFTWGRDREHKQLWE